MRRYIAWLGLGMLLALDGSARAQTQLLNGIAVIVNGSIVTYHDIRDYAAPAVDLISRQFGNNPQVLQEKIMEVERDAIDQLIERQLIISDFKAAGYAIPPAAMDASVQRRVKQQFGDKVSMTKSLQARGITFETYRKQVEEQIIVEAMTAQKIASDILISPYKIERYYEENRDQFKQEESVKLRMIVLNRPPGGTDTSVRKLAQDILMKLEEGVPFEEMARVNSEGSQRGQGGDWGWVERSVLRKELADAAFTLQPGQRSGVIVTEAACYIMQVEERRSEGVKALPDVRDEIEKTLRAQEQARLRNGYIGRLKKKAFIRYF